MHAFSLNVITNTHAGEHDLMSKVLVVEHDAAALAQLKALFESSRLVGYRASQDHALAILGNNIDLGGIFVPGAGEDGSTYDDLIAAVRAARPDLPIFVRQMGTRMDTQEMQGANGIFVYADIGRARDLVETYLFGRHYPNEFVAAMKDMTLDALRASFKDMQFEVEPPYIVMDKLIYGELFSLIPIESEWCRGYMMVQSEEERIRAMIQAKKTSIAVPEPSFLHVNALLGELSNLIWGSFKNRYGAKGHAGAPGQVRVEVPIIVNHGRKYISFGTDDPQLCFKFTVIDPDGKLAPTTIYQKFIFSLDWAPEKYAESNRNVSELVNSGELELF